MIGLERVLSYFALLNRFSVCYENIFLKPNNQCNIFYHICFSSIMQIGPGESTLKRNFAQIQEGEGRRTPAPFQPPKPPRGANERQQQQQQQQQHRHHQHQHQQQQQPRQQHQASPQQRDREREQRHREREQQRERERAAEREREREKERYVHKVTLFISFSRLFILILMTFWLFCEDVGNATDRYLEQ